LSVFECKFFIVLYCIVLYCIRITKHRQTVKTYRCMHARYSYFKNDKRLASCVCRLS